MRKTDIQASNYVDARRLHPRRDSSRIQARALLRHGQDDGLAAHQLTCSGVSSSGGDVGGARGYSGRQTVAAGPPAANGRNHRVRRSPGYRLRHVVLSTAIGIGKKLQGACRSVDRRYGLVLGASLGGVDDQARDVA